MLPQNVSEFFQALYAEGNESDLHAFVADPDEYLETGRLAEELSEDHKSIILSDEQTIKATIESETGRPQSAMKPLWIVKF